MDTYACKIIQNIYERVVIIIFKYYFNIYVLDSFLSLICVLVWDLRAKVARARACPLGSFPTNYRLFPW